MLKKFIWKLIGVSSIMRIRRSIYKTIKTEITPKDNNKKSKCPEKEIQIRLYKIANTKTFKIILTYSKINKCRKHVFKLLIINKKIKTRDLYG